MRRIYQEIYERARPFLRTRKNLIHTKISLHYVLRLLEEEKGDEEVVIPAILLHDVGWKTVPARLQLTAFGPNPSNPELTNVHEVNGAKIAGAILEELHYPPDKVREICRIIRGHDTRKKAISPSDRLVKDADKLSRYSRRGVTIDLDRFGVPRRDYLNFLEEQIDQWFFLPTSRKWAQEEIALRKKGRGKVRRRKSVLTKP